MPTYPTFILALGVLLAASWAARELKSIRPWYDKKVEDVETMTANDYELLAKWAQNRADELRKPGN